MALRGLVRQLDAIGDALAELETLIDAAFLAHPDGRIISSVPGLGVALGARLLAEIGDDHSRFADGRALKAFAGAAPVTRASGRSTFMLGKLHHCLTTGELYQPDEAFRPDLPAPAVPAAGTAQGSVDSSPVRPRPRWKDQHRAQAIPDRVPA